MVLFANTDWYLYNFRLGLVRHLKVRLGCNVVVACPDGPHRGMLEAEGCTWWPVPLSRRSLNPLRDLPTLASLARDLGRSRADLIHNFGLKCILAGTLASYLGGVPRIVNEATGLGTLFTGEVWRYRFGRALVRGFLRTSMRRPRVRTLFQNEGDASRIAPARSTGGLRIVPGSGVDTERFHPAPLMPSRPVVLTACRLLRSKGIETFCMAARAVSGSVEGVEFRIAGTIDPGNPESFSAEEVSNLALRFPEVRFLGHCEGMPELWREASIAVLASEHEGMPRSLVEAAASGLPLVSSDIPGVKGLVNEGRNGMLVPVGDPAALGRALRELLADRERCARYGQASRELAVSTFNLEAILGAIQDTYRDLGLPGRLGSGKAS